MCGEDQRVFPWPGETVIPGTLPGAERKNILVQPKRRALWRWTAGPDASGGVEIGGTGAVVWGPSRR